MGGPADCEAVIKGNTQKEMIDNGTEHLKKAHPKMAEDMKAMPKEEGEKWMAQFQKKWDATPEM